MDTCVIVSAVKSRSGASFFVVELARNGQLTAILTTALVNEYEDVLYRPEHRVPGWKDEDLYALIQTLITPPPEWVDTNFSYRPALQDVGDELVLEAAINGQAESIVTFNVKAFQARGSIWH